jgi:hypothetical protein
VARSALQYILLYLKQHDFLKNVIEYKMLVLIFSTTFVQTFLIEKLSEM